MRAALGLKARTGRAILVALAGDARAPQLLERSQFTTVPSGHWAPYHEAGELEPAAARDSVRRGIAAAHRMAEEGIRSAVQRLAGAGHEARGAAVLIGTGMPDWSTDQILAVHVRMHKAEGELFRNVLVAGARTCKLALTTLPEKTALDDAAKKLGLARPRLDAQLAALGKSAGPPWGKDQKEAAAAALVALGRA